MIEHSFLKGLESALFGHPSDTKRRPIAIQHQPRWLGWRAPPRHAPAGHSSERFVFVHGFVLKRLCRTVRPVEKSIELKVDQGSINARLGVVRRGGCANGGNPKKPSPPRGPSGGRGVSAVMAETERSAKFESLHAWVDVPHRMLIRASSRDDAASLFAQVCVRGGTECHVRGDAVRR